MFVFRIILNINRIESTQKHYRYRSIRTVVESTKLKMFRISQNSTNTNIFYGTHLSKVYLFGEACKKHERKKEGPFRSWIINTTAISMTARYYKTQNSFGCINNSWLVKYILVHLKIIYKNRLLKSQLAIDKFNSYRYYI